MNKSYTWIIVLILLLLVLLVTIAKSMNTLEESNSVTYYTNDDDLSESQRAHLFNRRTRKKFLKLFRRKIKIPEKSSLSLNAQVSRPNIFPRPFNQAEGIIIDGVIEWPTWLDLDDFAEDMYGQSLQNHHGGGGRDESKASNYVGKERCFLYEKLEWLLEFSTQLPNKVSHACLLKFICETQAIYSFYPEFPTSIAFELIHLILTPSFGVEHPCFEEYIIAENTGRTYGRCETYDSSCPFSVGGILIRNFFPVPSPIPPIPIHQMHYDHGYP